MSEATTERRANLVGLTRRDVNEVRAYFDGISQGVVMACAQLKATDEQTKDLLRLVDSHIDVFNIGWKG